MSKDPMKWLTDDRKLSADLLSAMGVKTVRHPALGAAIAFPYILAGETYAAKFRTVEKRFASTSNVSRGLYNEDDLGRMEALPIVICEGEIDALSVMQAGFERAVSVPDGWTKEGNKTDALLSAEDALRRSPFVIVAGDNDEAGESLPRAVANILKGHDVRRAVWPAGCKDANDVLVAHGEGGLAAALNNVDRIDPPGGCITALSDLPAMSERRVLRISEAPFDRVIALQLGEISVWTGTPGSGKSTFATWAAERVTLEENIRAGILGFETHPHDYRDQLCLIRTGKDYASLDDATRQKVIADLDNRFRFVHVVIDDDVSQTLKWLESMVYTLAVREQCKLVIIDPWNELEHLPEPGESMTQYINFALKFIRGLAKQLDIHIAIVAHPKKMPTDRDRAPTGYDIADSAAFYNKPGLGITVHRRRHEDPDTDELEEWVDLHVWKVRNTRLYRMDTGKVYCQFDRDLARYVRRVSPSQDSGQARDGKKQTFALMKQSSTKRRREGWI